MAASPSVVSHSRSNESSSAVSPEDKNSVYKSSNSLQVYTGGEKGDKPSFSSNVDQRNKVGILPLFFERASSSIWKPAFDSRILEKEFQRFSVVLDRHRFQTGALLLAIACLFLAIYFCVTKIIVEKTAKGIELTVGAVSAAVIAFAVFLLTKFGKIYQKPKEAFVVSLVFTTFFLVIEIFSVSFIEDKEFSFVAQFVIATSLILLVYTMMPALPMYLCLILGVIFSVLHESVVGVLGYQENLETDQIVRHAVGHGILHLGIHLTGLTVFFMAQVRKRSTFWRVGQSVVAKRDLEIEKQIKERMIRLAMPKMVADWLNSEGLVLLQKTRTQGSEPKVPFRPFKVFRMENTSILFADIVGFTKMSSNKSAETLVNLLNNLFARFDELAFLNDCEKISTLGDCYYCVAGCPEATPYHALCCVEMGLDIVEQIKKFRQEMKEDVDMRVGIHTGSVLCGIVGDRRRRFDVWSNDVSVANRMEAGGRPGRVHLTEETLKFLNDEYTTEEGDGISRAPDQGHLKTYFIVARKNGVAGIKPWQLEKRQRDSNSSLRQAIKSGLNASSENIDCSKGDKVTCKKKEDKARQTNISPVHDSKVSTSDVQVSVQDGISPDTQKAVKKTKFAVAEDDSIEMSYLGKTQSPLQSPLPKLHMAHQLIKTPLPFQGLNFSCGLTLNEALMRDAVRASNDQQLVNLMHDKKTQKVYFFNPPLTPVISQFQSKAVEEKYRRECFKSFKLNPKVTTFASPKVHYFFDVITSTMLFIFILIVCFLFFTLKQPPVSLIVLTPMCALIIVVVLIVHCLRTSAITACCPNKFDNCVTAPKVEEDRENSVTSQTSNSDTLGPDTQILPPPGNHDGQILPQQMKKKRSVGEVLTSPWVLSHMHGALLMCLPMVLVFSTMQDYASNSWDMVKLGFFSNLVTISLLPFCGFTQLSSVMKSVLALIWSVAFIVILIVFAVKPAKITFCQNVESTCTYRIIDIIVATVLQIVVLIILNRLHEKGVRVNYYADKEAAEQKNSAQEQKEVADSLLLDMFPRHVSEQLKYKNHCSKNYDNVGVLFATIVNFDEFYEENFAGGIECIRVLHEVVADFDKELEKVEDVEKIKTVHGTTFMAASGLNSSSKSCAVNRHPHEHLKNLVDFALAIQRALNDFNNNMLGFRFHMRCGFNAGPVTAGVIGTSKPQYDIWGDTVNLASRMDSTGVADEIQVSEDSMKMLKDFFTFEKRGVVYVKGKEDMTTYLLKEKNKSLESLSDSCPG